MATVTITTAGGTQKVDITTGTGTATQTILVGARGPQGVQGPPGSSATIDSYVSDIATLPDYPTSFPTTPADINNIGGHKLIGRHTGTTGAGQEIGIDGGLAFQGGQLKVDLATAASTWRTELGLGSLATLSSVSLTTNVTGTLPVANGGTGGTTSADARTNLGLGTTATPTFAEVRGAGSFVVRMDTGSNTRVALSSDSVTLGTNSGYSATLDNSGFYTNVTTPLGKSTNRWSTTWTTNANVSTTLTVGSATWNGSTISGAQTLSGQVEMTGQAATNSTSAMTRALGDARFAPISIAARSTTQIDATSTTLSDVTGMTGIALEANTWYRMEFAGLVTSGTSASWNIELNTTQSFARTSGSLPSVGNAGNTAVAQAVFRTSTQLIILQRQTSGTAIPNFQTVIFKTGASAPTVKVQFSQWVTPTNTASLLADAAIVFTKLPIA